MYKLFKNRLEINQEKNERLANWQDRMEYICPNTDRALKSATQDLRWGLNALICETNLKKYNLATTHERVRIVQEITKLITEIDERLKHIEIGTQEDIKAVRSVFALNIGQKGFVFNKPAGYVVPTEEERNSRQLKTIFALRCNEQLFLDAPSSSTEGSCLNPSKNIFFHQGCNKPWKANHPTDVTPVLSNVALMPR